MGPLPDGWQIKRLKFIARVQTGMAKGKELQGVDTVEVPYLRVANVQDGYLDLDEVATMPVPVADLDRYRLQPGDVLMNEGGDFDKLGRGHVWHGQIDPCIHQNHVFAVRPHGVSPDWLNAYTGSAPAQFFFMQQSKQSTNLASISSSNLMELPVPVPPLEEQGGLLRAFQREAVRLDLLIQKKSRVVELLSEKRQVLIADAVRQGLDPHVPMKDSGIQWLGMVPRSWGVVRIRYEAQLESGHTPDKKIAKYWTDCSIPWVSLSDSDQLRHTDHISETSKLVNELGIANSSARLLPAGSVLMTRDATVGLAAIAGCTLAVSQHLVAWVPGAKVASEYLLYVIRAMGPWLHILETGTTIKTVGMDDIKNLVMPLPPLSEQKVIVSGIEAGCKRIDALIAATLRSIKLLRERRAALITAVVKGEFHVPKAT